MRLFALALALVLVALSSACATQHQLVARAALEPAVDAGVLFTNVDVFDGEQSLGKRDVLVRKGVIERVAAPHTLPVAPGVARIDGAGRTLLPGLIDSHAHLESH